METALPDRRLRGARERSDLASGTLFYYANDITQAHSTISRVLQYDNRVNMIRHHNEFIDQYIIDPVGNSHPASMHNPSRVGERNAATRRNAQYRAPLMCDHCNKIRAC
ncbi:MAG: hypothetical protein ABI338_07580 [Gemmatimonadaceae bacterium]